MELAGILVLSLAVGLGLVVVAVALLRWVFLAPLIKELKVVQAKLDRLHETSEYSSRQLQSIWNSVNMIRDRDARSSE